MIYKESEGNFHYTPGYLLHLWHGDKKYRLYSYRHKRMHEFGYDPQNDLTFNKDQCWEWNTSDQKLIRWVKYYFYARNEESKFYTYLYNKIISFQFNLRKRLQSKVKED